MATIVQESFTGGELSPELHARTSLSKYATGLAKANNIIVKAHGGAVNRAGTQFIGEVQDSANVGRIVPFSFNTEQTYALEFNNLTMRVIKDAGYVLEANKTITGITQANPAVVTSSSHGFANGDEVYISSVVGMTEVNGKNFKIANVSTHTFSLKDLGGTAINSSAYTAYSSAGTAARVFTMVTPYVTADLPKLKYTQSADVLTITHRNYAVRDLTRTGHDAWTLNLVSFTPTQAFPAGISVTPTTTGSTVYRYQVTAFNEENGEESLPGVNTTTKTISAITKADPAVVTATSHGFANGDQVALAAIVGMTELNGRRFRIAGVTTHTFQLVGEDSSNHTTYASDGTANLTYFKITNGHVTANNTITWTEAVDADSYSIYKDDNGLYGFIGTTEELTFTDDNIEATLIDTPPKERNPFLSDYPSTVTFFEQRKVYANTTLKPQSIFMSQSANYNNMTFSSPRKDDDAITRTIAGREVNEIRHLVPVSDLVVLTVGGEWRLFAGSNAVITPTSIIIKPQETHGCSDVRPLTVGGSILYVQAQGNKVRDLGYKLETDMYSGTDLSILSEHLLLSHEITDWCYAEIPFSVIWSVRDDGVLLGLTYLREHEVWAWHRHDIANGQVESICSIVEDKEDAVYIIVKRTINNRVVRYVERLHSRIFSDLQDAFFVDCGLTYDNPITITDVTNASPGVITASSHGMINGDVVDVTSMTAIYSGTNTQTSGMTELNGNNYVVANAATNTFTLTDSNGVAINTTAFNAYVTGQGEARKSITTVTGLGHLEGEDVVALANGDVVTGLTVASGSVTLPSSASRIHIGYNYYSDMQTLRPEVKSTDRPTVVGKKRKVSSVDMRVIDTRGLQAGPDVSNLVEAQQGLVVPVTGDIEVTVRPTWSKEGTIYVRQANPLPMEVIAISAEIEFES